MRFRVFCWLALLAGTSALLVSCGPPQGKGHGTRKETVKVSGSVTVNGKPEAGLQITASPVGGDVNDPYAGRAGTDEKGEFQFSTYVTNDGLPAGEYVLSITWSSGSGITPFQGVQKEDKLGGKYEKKEKNVSNPKLKFTVTAGQPLVLDTIDLERAAGSETKQRGGGLLTPE